MRAIICMISGALLLVQAGMAEAACPEKLGNDPGPAVLRDCVEEIAKLRTELRALTEGLQSQNRLGGISMLAVAAVRKRALISSSEGVEFDAGAGLLSFRNPEGLPFVPIIADFGDRDTKYITDTHYIQGTSGTDKVFIRAKALDTGGVERTADAHDFTAVIFGIRGSKKQ